MFALLLFFSLLADGPQVLQPEDTFQLEYAADPQIAPDGSYIVYVRTSLDIMTDGRNGVLWRIGRDGKNHMPLGVAGNASSPRFSPDGKKLAYISSKDGRSQIFMRWLDQGIDAPLSNLPSSPGSLQFSPDGKHLAFTMFIPEDAKPMVSMPAKPKGAEWADSAKVVDRLTFRADGLGMLPHGYRQLFVLPVEGGTARQLTEGSYPLGGGLTWLADSSGLIFSGERFAEHARVNNSELYQVDLSDGKITQLTDRVGPDRSPVTSPDGKYLAWLGYDDEFLGYQISDLYVRDLKSGETKVVTAHLDRGVGDPQWSSDGSLFFSYDSQGDSFIAKAKMDGSHLNLVRKYGGLSLGRPYSGGSYSVTKGYVAFTKTSPQHPADLAVYDMAAKRSERLTRLNDDLFEHKSLATIEEIIYKSSHDGQEIQGWIAKPPGFEEGKKYPMILEIHGGPFANYGDRFAMEIQLYAAAGYVVLYTNPRGSSSYGKAFGNLIHHNYPGNDYDDLMSGVDAVLQKGYVDENRLFVTGGSGGGVLTATIVGKTDRFKAAVVAKPVINWFTFVLTADNPAFFYKYWFPGYPWEHQEHYYKRSPISLVGNVNTPTMLMTGEQDWRTPMWESEQFYTALKLRGVDAALVRIPGAGHGIANRPSQLIAKVLHILKWFERYDVSK